MKSILIKLGKTCKVIRQDGLFAGGKRVSGYVKKYCQAIFNFKSGQVLIITGGVGDSANYRAHHVAEELNLHGIKTEVTIQDNPFLPKFADKFNVFIFHRTLFTGTVEKLVTKIKQQKKEIIFETDDLVFDVKYMHTTDAYEKMGALEKKQYAKGVGEEIMQDDSVTTCTTTTAYLAKILEGYGKKVFVVPNKLSQKDVAITDEILEQRVTQRLSLENAKDGAEAKSQAQVRIGYFSGTASHNRDFTTITEALMAIMDKYAQVKLVLVGPLDIENKLHKFADRIEQSQYVVRAKHFANVAGVDINILPLEIGDSFCESKSELKFFEAGIVEVPTIASATQTFCEAITDGADGFVANSTQEWFEKLEKLITNDKLRKGMGKAARETALQKYTNKNSSNEEYYNYLRSKL